ncbi:MAG TPA: PIN domain-containing protein [Candidatus Binatia bacterium]
MAVMVETTLWVDHFRASTPQAVKDQVLPIVNQRNVCVVEPVLFELLANVPRRDRRRLENYFALVSLLPAQATLWRDTISLGQKCVDAGLTLPSMDLLIAAAAIHHDAEVVTFDAHFADIATLSPLRASVLTRAV